MFGDEFTSQTLVACSRRILANAGLSCLAQGHVSIRADDGVTFWVNPWGYCDETLPSDVVRMSSGIEKVEGAADKNPSPAVQFHKAIYDARPDINAIIHIHSHWVQLVSTKARIVESFAGESSMFEGLQVVFDALGDEEADLASLEYLEYESQSIAEGFGDEKSIMILPNHGAIVTGHNISEATVRAIILEHGARLDVEAQLIGGKPWHPGPDYAQAYSNAVIPQIWAANMRRLWKTDPDLVDVMECRTVHT